jgi:hypothetical protein
MSARRARDQVQTEISLVEIARQALEVTKKARKHRKSLSGDNFYGNKLADLRLDAASAFERLGEQSTGDATVIAELVEAIFATSTSKTDRLRALRELEYALRRSEQATPSITPQIENVEVFFPPTILAQANRSYISSIGHQMNGCFRNGWRDACAVMMRRLLEIVIIEVFEANGIAAGIKGTDGNYFHLSRLIDLTLSEPTFHLSRNTKTALPRLRDAGHLSAHGRFLLAAPEDISKIQREFRIVLEELLHHARLI